MKTIAFAIRSVDPIQSLDPTLGLWLQTTGSVNLNFHARF